MSSADAAIAAAQAANKTEMMYLGDSAVVGMALTFSDYQYTPKAGAVGQTNNTFSTSTGNVSALPSKTITFPLPKQLVDNISLNVGGKEIGTLGALTAGGIQAIGEKGLGQAAIDAVNRIRNQATQIGQNAASGQSLESLLADGASGANFLIRSGLGSILPQISQGIEAALGEAVNPHQTLTFDGVALKQHTFSFEFAPTSDKESKYIAQAIHSLKRNSLPTYANPLTTGDSSINAGNATALEGIGVSSNNTALGRGLLKYPKIVQPTFVSGIDDAFFYRMKPCMISNISVDYTPQGNALLRGGRPAFITLSLTLVEQAIHTSADYGEYDPRIVG